MLTASSSSAHDGPRCLYFERGRCRKGRDCPFLHIISRDQTTPQDNHASVNYNAESQATASRPESNSLRNPCQYFFSKGWCGYGNSCRFSHTSTQDDDLQGSLGASALQDDQVGSACRQRESEHTDVTTIPKGLAHGGTNLTARKLCRFYQAGYCQFGQRCRYQHSSMKHPVETRKRKEDVLSAKDSLTRESKVQAAQIVCSGADRVTDSRQFEKQDVEVTDGDVASENSGTEMLENVLSGNEKVEGKLGNSLQVGSSAIVVDSKCQKTAVREPKPVYKFSDETLLKMRETEMQQLRRRYPKMQEKISDDGCTTVKFVFEPTDPDWPYDVKQMTVAVSFPTRYPDEMMTVRLSDNERIPATVERCVSELIQDWVTDRHQSVNSLFCKELMFRPLMLWLDRNAEDLFTQALKEYKRELIAMAAGVQFIPASKLRQIYPEAARKTSLLSTKPQATETADIGSNVENQGLEAQTANGDGNETRERKSEDGDGDDEKENDAVVGSEGEHGDSTAMASKAASIRKGTEASLMSLQLLNGTATLMVSRVKLIVSCIRCTNNTELQLVPGRVYTAACVRCHSTHVIEFNAVIAHQMSSIIGYMNIDGCRPFDVILADCQFQIGCLNCSKETLIDSVSPGQLNNTWCLHCHQKLTVVTEGIRFVQLTPAGQLDTSKAVQLVVKKPIKSVRDPAIQEGHALPNCGTCRHFKKSFRWLRFPCCGKAYPCNICHDEMESDHIMKFANRTICGFCAKEQPYASDRPCIACNGILTNRTTAHWEGGKGCRDKIRMSRLDSKKYANSSKTLSRSTEQKLDPSIKTIKLRHV